MKHTKLLLIGAALFAAVITTGCMGVQKVSINPITGISETNTVEQLDPNKVATGLKTIIPGAVKLVPSQYRIYVVDAQGAACSLIGSTNVTPDDINAIFNQTGIASIKTPEVEGVTVTIYGIYSAFYDDLVLAHLPQNQIVADMTIVLQGICDSLTTGLNESAPATVTIPPPAAIQ